MTRTREGRPTADTVAPAQISVATSISNSIASGALEVRCNRCGALLTAERSIALELGPVCRRLEVAA